MTHNFALILDVTVVLLLLITIAFVIRLNRQLTVLRDSRDELEELIAGFSEATDRAEAGVAGLHRAAAESGETLQKAVNRAQSLRDELQFMIEAADSLANRLEAVVRGGNDRVGTPPPVPPAAAKPRPVRPTGTDDRDAGPRRPVLPDVDHRIRPVAEGTPRLVAGGSGALDGTSSRRGTVDPVRRSALDDPVRRSALDDDEDDDDMPDARGARRGVMPIGPRQPGPLFRAGALVDPPVGDDDRNGDDEPLERRARARDGQEALSRAERDLLRAMEKRR